MKIIDTMVLIAYINPLDARREKAAKHIINLSKGLGIFVPSASLIELDLELKAHNVSDEAREAIYFRLIRLIPAESIFPITPTILRHASELAPKAKWRGAYFDTLIVATGLEYGAESAITTDRKFLKLGLKITF